MRSVDFRLLQYVCPDAWQRGSCRGRPRERDKLLFALVNASPYGRVDAIPGQLLQDA
jgi:hypothetical protein